RLLAKLVAGKQDLGKSKEVVPEKKESQEVKKEEPESVPQNSRVRRNALEVKKAVDEELKELEQKEKQWDIPAFLRNK
ncbi:MAG TPA: hypothetical protein VJC15_02740, partial [Candidatus Paceibacterota bacterium]